MSVSSIRRKTSIDLKPARLAMVVLAGLTLLGFAPASWAAVETVDDSAITIAVETALLVEDGISSHMIDVTTHDGVVTLSGSVSHLLEKDRVIAAVRRVKGVRSIVDELTLRAVEREDEDIRNDVEQALMLDPATDSYEIAVAVNDGVVTLTGTVESWAEKRLATEVAKGVRGVKDIHNQVTYSYESDRPDSEIEADIEARLRTDPYVDEGLVDVEVDEGVVTLSGTVGSLAEKSYARDNTRVAGIKRVIDDDLVVREWTRDDMERKHKVVPIADDKAEEAVEDALIYDPRVASFEIDVEVQDGEATLTGTVDNLMAKRSAGRDAKNTVGVWNVRNYIKVRPNGNMTDTEIAQHVRESLLWDPIVDRFEIGVAVRNRKVYLTGVVDYDFEKEQAEEVAAGINGVASVDNNLIVRQGWPWKSDAEIEEDIESEFMWSPFVDGSDLTVRVDNGHVELAGKVDTWHEYREAVENAFEGGAKTVRSYMRVEANDKVYDRYWSEAPEEVWPL